MTPLEILLDAFKYYGINVLAITGNHVKVQNNYEVEIEANGLYKLWDDGYVVAPFDDLDELCGFVLG